MNKNLLDSLFGSHNSDKKEKTVSKYKDGLTFIESISSQQKDNKSPIKSVNTIQSPVNQKWQIWYWRPNSGHYWHWEDFLQMKSSFTTKDEFWRSYNDLNGFELGLLGSHFNYCVFKDDIKPMWEDPANRAGGRWILEFPRKWDWKHISNLNEIWLKLLLSITGNNGSYDECFGNICGAVLMIRHNINKIAIWTANASNTLLNLQIGQAVRASTGFSGKMYFTSHYSREQKIVVNREKRIRFKSSPNYLQS